MALHQRGQRFHFGPLEAIWAALLAITLLFFLNWWLLMPSQLWQAVPAHVFALSTVGQSNSSLEVAFYYVADGQIYYGFSRPNTLQRAVFLTLPRSLRDHLQQKGYVTFEDLPREIRQVLENRGILGFEHIPEALVGELRARGFASERDIPERSREILRRGDKKEIAAELDRLLPMIPLGSSGQAESGGPLINIDLTKLSLDRSLITVWYDPANPDHFRVEYLPGFLLHLRLVLFLFSGGALIFFSARVYPKYR